MNGARAGALGPVRNTVQLPWQEKGIREPRGGREGRIRPYNHGPLFRPHPECLRTPLQLGTDLDRGS
ncbi:hypothetical protein NL676_025163 [Syzygium grande]|nr:hypothetical protein NL676_025163 [Syzygium grande]